MLIIESFGSKTENESTSILEDTVVKHDIPIIKHYKIKLEELWLYANLLKKRKFHHKTSPKVISEIKQTEPSRCSEMVLIIECSNKHNIENIMKVILKQNNQYFLFMYKSN